MNQPAATQIAAVTGANGYVGTHVSEALSEAGFSVSRLVRRPEPGSDDRVYDIGDSIEPGTLQGVDVLVHCAYDFSATSRAAVWKSNVYGTRTLLSEATTSDVRRTIVISSMSAYSGTHQIYGRAKLATELDAFSRGMCVVRPGLIYGPGWGGMAGTLRKLTSLPITPLVGRRAHQFTLHEDDLRSAIITLAQADRIPLRPLGLAHPDPVSFQHLLRAIGETTSGHSPRFLPIPWFPLYWALKAAERLPVTLPVRADSLLGLVRPAPSVPNVEAVRDMGIRLRSFSLE